MIELTKTRRCHERYCRKISDGSLAATTGGVARCLADNRPLHGFTILQSSWAP